MDKKEITERLRGFFQDDTQKIAAYLQWVKTKGLTVETLIQAQTIKKYLDETGTKRIVKHGKYLFTRTYKCLFDDTPFTAYKLYPSAKDKFEKVDDFFDVIYYENPSQDPDFCNYLVLEVKVCPACYFSSSADEHFISDTPHVQPFEPDGHDREAIAISKMERESLSKQSQHLQTPSRSLGDGFASFRLGIHSSLALYHSNPRKNAIELTRAGTYALKGARLSYDPASEQDKERWFREAFELFSKAMDADIKGTSYYKSIYQLAALAIHFGENTLASRCYEIFRQLSKTEQARSLNIYSMRLRKIWQDRADYQSQGTP